MKSFKACLFAAVSAGSFTIAQAQMAGGATGQLLPNDVPTTSATDSSETGTILNKSIKWQSKIPLNKTYAELTPEQKEALHAMYQSLPPGDEPPFPEKGIKPIFNAVRNAQTILHARGELNMVVTVGPDGKAIKVENFSNTRNPRITEATQQVLLLQKYKPGICGGTPCTMQFRFTQSLNAG
jgi:hypothetical protein